MRKLLLLCVLLMAPSSYALEIADVKLADEVKLDKYSVQLNGAGLRKKFLFHVYIGALYLEKKSDSDEAVLADTGAKRMSFHLLREVSGKQVLDGINEAILPNNSLEEMNAIESRLNKFATIFKAIPQIKSGEEVSLDYIPGYGTRISLSGVEKGHIEGADFNKALLKIWLGKRPVQSSLKKSVLGIRE